MTEKQPEAVWIFHGAGGQFSSGVFSNLEIAESWIKKHGLTGLLTLYPLNQGVYDWALANNFFEVKDDCHTSTTFIQKFTTGSQEHYHYEDGERA